MGIFMEIETAKRDLVEALDLLQLREKQYQIVDATDEKMHDIALERWENAKRNYDTSKKHLAALIKQQKEKEGVTV